MSKNDKNTFTKILIVLVIASFALLAIVYVLNKVQKDGGGSNLTTPSNIEKMNNQFNKLNKIIVTDDIKTTDNCGNFGCEKIVYTEGEWKLGKAYDLKFLNNNESAEITIPNYQECANEEYILPAYNTLTESNVYWNNFVPFYPCDDTNNNKSLGSYSITSEIKENDDLNYYFENINLMTDYNEDVVIDTLETKNYKGQDYISYMLAGMIDYNCIFILGDEYKHNICYPIPNESDDTTILDNIKILK